MNLDVPIRVPELESGARTQLLDGWTVSLRCLDADDADAVRRLHERLSDQDRYFRFFTHHPTVLDELVHRLTQSGDGQTAIGAFDNDRLIGAANFALCEDPSIADVAVVVTHEDHMHGVGTALLRHLAQLARRQGVRCFTADILAKNHLMLKLLSDSGLPYRRIITGPVLHVEIELSGVAKSSGRIPSDASRVESVQKAGSVHEMRNLVRPRLEE